MRTQQVYNRVWRWSLLAFCIDTLIGVFLFTDMILRSDQLDDRRKILSFYRRNSLTSATKIIILLSGTRGKEKETSDK